MKDASEKYGQCKKVNSRNVFVWDFCVLFGNDDCSRILRIEVTGTDSAPAVIGLLIYLL